MLSLSLIVTKPPTSPVGLFGDQETVILQDCPGPTLAGQLLPSDKSVPFAVMLLMVRFAFRLFVRVVLSARLQMHMGQAKILDFGLAPLWRANLGERIVGGNR